MKTLVTYFSKTGNNLVPAQKGTVVLLLHFVPVFIDT